MQSLSISDIKMDLTKILDPKDEVTDYRKWNRFILEKIGNFGIRGAVLGCSFLSVQNPKNSGSGPLRSIKCKPW